MWVWLALFFLFIVIQGFLKAISNLFSKLNSFKNSWSVGSINLIKLSKTMLCSIGFEWNPPILLITLEFFKVNENKIF